MKITLSALLLALCFGATSYAQTDDSQQLENRVRESGHQTVEHKHRDWRAIADSLSHVTTIPACKAASYEMIGKKYAVSIDANGQPCRLYDLSFPTLQAMLKSLTVTALPTQKYTVRDYLNWINGNFNDVNGRMHRYQGIAQQRSPFMAMSADDQPVETADWVYELKFKSDSGIQNLAAGGSPLPKSFRASDLELGTEFMFNPHDRARLLGLVNTLKALGASPEIIQAWNDAAHDPKTFLKNLKFDWNDAKKVYDVALSGRFVPVLGPVALVDYTMPERPAIEKLVRTVMIEAIGGLAGFIPEPLTQRIVKLAVEEAGNMLETAYAYQYRNLEYTLRSTSQTISGHVDAQMMSKTMDLLFVNNADLVTEYLNAMSAQQKFNMPVVAAKARYMAEKSRDMMMNQTLQRLATKSGCTVSMLDDFFANCERGNQHAIFSLISTQNLLFWNLGGPMIYRADAPYLVMAKRGVSYLLYLGLRVFELPINSSIQNELQNATNMFAHAGVLDEAYLKAALWSQKQSSGSLSMADDQVLKMLYVQHLNPFLAMSEKEEAGYIAANKAILKINTDSAATNAAVLH